MIIKLTIITMAIEIEIRKEKKIKTNHKETVF